MKHLGIFSISVFIISCGQTQPGATLPAVQPAENVATFTSFQWVKGNVFGQCTNCHRPPEASKGIDLTTYESTIASGTVVPGSPDSSRIYTSLVSGKMPMGAPRLSPEQIDGVRSWIAAGAKND